jgi:predicted nuclease of restriction endonuclease-like (RecB) superfamily
MTKEEKKELEIAKKNISYLIKDAILELTAGFNIVSKSPVHKLNSTLNEVTIRVSEFLRDLDKKIQDELTWD